MSRGAGTARGPLPQAAWRRHASRSPGAERSRSDAAGALNPGPGTACLSLHGNWHLRYQHRVAVGEHLVPGENSNARLDCIGADFDPKGIRARDSRRRQADDAPVLGPACEHHASRCLGERRDCVGPVAAGGACRTVSGELELPEFPAAVLAGAKCVPGIFDTMAHVFARSQKLGQSAYPISSWHGGARPVAAARSRRVPAGARGALRSPRRRDTCGRGPRGPRPTGRDAPTRELHRDEHALARGLACADLGVGASLPRPGNGESLGAHLKHHAVARPAPQVRDGHAPGRKRPFSAAPR